jgi:hypothetical protein
MVVYGVRIDAEMVTPNDPKSFEEVPSSHQDVHSIFSEHTELYYIIVQL